MDGFAIAAQAMEIAPMSNDKQLARFGFRFERGGTHSSRTMMLDELTALLSYVDRSEAKKADYLHAIEFV
jgi:hypothetical protein